MYSLLACSSRLAQPIFLYSPELPAKSGIAHSGLGPPTSVTNQENAPTGLPIGQSCRDIFSAVVSYTQATLAYAKVGGKKNLV